MIGSMANSSFKTRRKYRTMSSRFGVPPYQCEYLVIAGGASGGGDNNNAGGGGGAGGYRANVAGEVSGANSPAEAKLALAPGSYAITVGAGGALVSGTTAGLVGNAGNNSVFSSITSIGGSGGNGPDPQPIGGTGGSGVVIFRLPLQAPLATFSAGVTQTNTVTGPWRVYTVTATSTTSETVTIT